jgi:hypothetical protein
LNGTVILVQCLKVNGFARRNNAVLNLDTQKSAGHTMDIAYPVFEELIDMSRLRAHERPIGVGSDMHQLARYLEGWVKE